MDHNKIAGDPAISLFFTKLYRRLLKIGKFIYLEKGLSFIIGWNLPGEINAARMSYRRIDALDPGNRL